MTIAFFQSRTAAPSVRESVADIAHALRSRGVSVVTPRDEPDVARAADWFFDDDGGGHRRALDRGARVLWGAGESAEAPGSDPRLRGLGRLGQPWWLEERFADKQRTNELLSAHGCTTVLADLTDGERWPDLATLKLPVIVKPAVGRGSEGVTRASSPFHVREALQALVGKARDDRILVEEYLPGHEIAVTVMPPTIQLADGRKLDRRCHWALPPVMRFNHVDGVAPHDDGFPLSKNNRPISETELSDPRVLTVIEQCEHATVLLDARAPVRFDCRQSRSGAYAVFDVNLAPDLSGPGRPGRQAGLVAIAATAAGLSYQDLAGLLASYVWRA